MNLSTQLDLTTDVFEWIEWLPGAQQLLEPHRLAGQQPDNLCGPYWVSVLLKGFGGNTIDPARLGQLAGSQLPIGDDPSLWVPPGANSRQDYAIALPTCSPSLAGTSVPGLIAATLAASSQSYTLVPIKLTWTGATVEAVLRLCQANAHWQAVPLCNVQTGCFWGSRLPLAHAIAYLTGASIQPPSADWSVGHFVTLAGRVRGAARSLVIVRDTYPSMGWDGYHLQPSEVVANALNRDDGSEGGIALFVATQYQFEVEHQCQQSGWAIAPWDNGTPDKSFEG